MIKLKTGRAPEKVVVKLKRTLEKLFGVDPGKYVKSPVKYTCLREDFCVLYSGLLTERDLDARLLVVYEGTWVGLYVKRLVVPSLSLTKSIYRERGVRAAIIVADPGIKAFLYGNDVLQQSVVEVLPPRLGLYAVVDQYDGEVVGFAKWNSKKRVYENVYDCGIFLRVLG